MKRLELNLVKCSEKMPEKDGQYTVVDLWRGVFSCNTVNYTVAAGWNSFVDYKGELHAESVIHFENVETHPDHYWAVSSVITEDDDE